MGRNEKIVLQTLLYSDIFNYPLTADEIWFYAISKSPISPRIVHAALQKLQSNLTHDGVYYCLKGRSKTIHQRILKEKESNKKIAIAKKVVWFLNKIPTIQFIGLSGSVALKNARENDDIDLFFIVQDGSVWVTRLIVVLFLDLLSIGRRRKNKKVANMICPNMFLTISSLEIPKSKRNIYIAHEIVQVKSLFDRGFIHDMFLNRNKWVLEYMSNSFLPNKRTVKSYSYIWLSVIEKMAKILQVWYIKRHITTEIISDTMLAFHPKNYEEIIINEFIKRIHKYNAN